MLAQLSCPKKISMQPDTGEQKVNRSKLLLNHLGSALRTCLGYVLGVKVVTEGSASDAKQRLRCIIAVDRKALSPRRLTAENHRAMVYDHLARMLEDLVPMTVLSKFSPVAPLPHYDGQVIKWRKFTPIQLEDSNNV